MKIPINPVTDIDVTTRKVYPENRVYKNMLYRYGKTLISLPPNEYVEISDETNFSLFLTEEFKDFANKPYLILPQDEKEYFIIIPRFIDFQIGLLHKQTESYNIFIVNQYIKWLYDLPKEIEAELNFPDLPEAKIEDKNLKVSKEDKSYFWTNYRDYLSKRIDDENIRIKRGYRFDLLSALIRDGILPFSPQKISQKDLRGPRVKFQLREYQHKAWKKFLQYGAVGIYWPPSAGKTFFGIYAMSRISGPKLVIVPTRTLVDQWKNRIQSLARIKDEEFQIITYHSAHKIKNKSFSLVIFDEHQYLPANTFSRLSSLKTKYRIGLTATPFREDGRTELIFALTGYPVGINWAEMRTNSVIVDPDITIFILSTEPKKFKFLGSLLECKETLIFCDSIATGKMLSKRYDIPFIYGKTKNRLEVLKNNQISIISRVGDEGLSIDDLEVVIEVDFLFGSRRQELQRVGRLLHSNYKGEHFVLMTEQEYSLYKKRFSSLYEKGIDIEIYRVEE